MTTELERARARARLCFALDFPTSDEAAAVARELQGAVGLVKVGLELYVAHGPEVVARMRALGFEVFLDLKLCDIPATVERATAQAARLGARLLTVHALGGAAMLAAAVRAAGTSGTQIVAVTVLTSLDAGDLEALGLSRSPGEQVERLAAVAWGAGVRAFVCSPQELGRLRARFPEATLIAPGIRLPGDATGAGDQKRVASPAEALAAGADVLVVGRPIRDARDRRAAADAVVDDMALGPRRLP